MTKKTFTVVIPGAETPEGGQVMTTTCVPSIRDLLQQDVFDLADWFLRNQFAVKDAATLLATIPVTDKYGSEIGLVTSLYSEFVVILLKAAGWQPISDDSDDDSYAVCFEKNHEGYRAVIGLNTDGRTTLIEQVEG